MARAKKVRKHAAEQPSEHQGNKVQLGLYHFFAWSARLLILALVIAVPWFYGGAQWQTQQVIVWAAAAIGLATLIATAIAPRPSYSAHLTYFMLVLLLIGLAQTLPLPASSAGWLSTNAFIADAKQAAQVSSADAASQATFFGKQVEPTISICSSRSRAALAVFSAAILVLWASSHVFGSRRWAYVLVIALCVSGLANACLGLMQRVAWNGWSLLEFKTLNYYSTFVSRNSAADYLATALAGLLILLSMAYRARKKVRRQDYRMTYPSASLGAKIRNRMEDIFIDLDTWGVGCLCAIAIVFVSILSTYSRGGTVAMFGAIVVTMSLTLAAKDGAVKGIVTSVVVLLIAVLVLVAFNLDEQLVNRFDELNQVAYEQKDGRLTVWGYSLSAIAWYWLCGSGLCTYQFALLPFHDGGPAVWFQHAENLYLEICVEFGLLGLAITVAAVAYMIRDLARESLVRKEGLLFPGVVFLLFVLILHSFVDFALILPGVFLPAAALFGAFDGRVRRISTERKRRESKESKDARLTYGKTDESRDDRTHHSWRRQSFNLAILCVCLFAQWRGLHDLEGFARAEELRPALELLEQKASSEVVAEEDAQTIQSQLAQLVKRCSGNPDALLLAGRAEVLVMRCELLKQLEEVEPLANRWQLTHPHATISFLAVPSDEPSVQRLQALIRGSEPRGQRLAASIEHFKDVLASCPMDARAAWGIYLSGLEQISVDEEELTGVMLMLLSRNNPYVLFKAGLVAITSSAGDSQRRKLGMRVLALSIELDKAMMDRGLSTMLDYLPEDQIVAMLPRDVVVRARMARSASSMSEQGQRLAKSLVKQISPDLKTAVATDSDSWAALAWVAREAGDKPLTIRLLRRTLVAGNDNAEIRRQLAEVLHENGQNNEAVQEANIIRAKYPSMEGVVGEMIKRWKQSVDRPQ